MLRPAVFLDRDGTIIEEVGYLADPAAVVLIDGAAAAIARLNAAGVPVVVVTNQAGVARGYFPEECVGRVHDRLDELLAREGARVDGYFVCPHHPSEGRPPYRRDCDCRKPAAGLLLRAAEQLGLDLARSFMIGDKLSDVEAGARAGCGTVLVRTGYGRDFVKDLRPDELRLCAVSDSLPAAIDVCLARLAPAERAG
jgi:D-glycero-D-manno-heptose 1,7-bisphosphate phosphatase